MLTSVNPFVYSAWARHRRSVVCRGTIVYDVCGKSWPQTYQLARLYSTSNYNLFIGGGALQSHTSWGEGVEYQSCRSMQEYYTPMQLGNHCSSSSLPISGWMKPGPSAVLLNKITKIADIVSIMVYLAGSSGIFCTCAAQCPTAREPKVEQKVDTNIYSTVALSLPTITTGGCLLHTMPYSLVQT